MVPPNEGTILGDVSPLFLDQFIVVAKDFNHEDSPNNRSHLDLKEFRDDHSSNNLLGLEKFSSFIERCGFEVYEIPSHSPAIAR